jgi:hypothetical protein
MHARVFGDGVEFLRAPQAQQAAQMAARLRWLHLDHGIPLDDVIGGDLVALLDRCQIRFEAMVNHRGARTGKSLTDVRELRNRLRRQLYTYCGAVGSMIDGDPASVAIVEAALRPILVARANSRRKVAGTGVEALEDELGQSDEMDDIASELGEEPDPEPEAPNE